MTNPTPDKDQPVDEPTFEQKLRFEILVPFYSEMGIAHQEDLVRDDNVLSDKSHIYTKAIKAITELCQAECNRAREAWADEFLQWYMGGRMDSDFFADKQVVYELIERTQELQQLMKEGGPKT